MPLIKLILSILFLFCFVSCNRDRNSFKQIDDMQAKLEQQVIDASAKQFAAVNVSESSAAEQFSFPVNPFAVAQVLKLNGTGSNETANEPSLANYIFPNVQINELTLVGTLQKGNLIIALIQFGQQIEQVNVGDYIGINEAEVIRINEEEVVYMSKTVGNGKLLMHN